MNGNFWSCQFREPVIIINLVVQALLRVSKPDLVWFGNLKSITYTYTHTCAHTQIQNN